MQIDKGEQIAALPILKLRDFFRQRGQRGISPELVCRYFGVKEARASQILDELCVQGYLASDSVFSSVFLLTPQGFALAQASAAKRLKRMTAMRMLDEFMERLAVVESSEYAYRPKFVLLFGSLLTEAETVGDIDLVMELEANTDGPALMRWRQSRIEVAERNFRSWVEADAWPEVEVLRALKNGNNALKFHTAAGVCELKCLKYRILRGDAGVIERFLPQGERVV